MVIGFSAVYTGPREIHYLFVDGASLRARIANVSRQFFGGQNFLIDFARLAANFTKTFYYDAVPVRESDEDETAYNFRIKSQRELLDSAAKTHGMHVYEGDARKRRKVGLEQKKVDVMITVDMLTHSFRRNMHQATLLTGDNDFKPLLDALVLEGMYVTLWCPPDETSQELMNAADARRKLHLQEIYNLLTTESQRRLPLPAVANRNPTNEPGVRLCEWHINGIRHILNREDGDFIVLRDGDANNRLHVRHHDERVLRAYCKEVLDFDIPA